jgi:plastocyanin
MRKIGFTVAASVGGILIVAVVATAAARIRTVWVEDRCDPASFNAVLGEGACVETNGDKVTFDKFIKALFNGGHPAWRFNPKRPEVRTGDIVQAANTGGEVHTFTEVAAFGGGFVPELNEPLGLTPVPECLNETIVGPTFVLPGGSLDVEGLSQGVHRFQCCIHPWMRAEVKVKK